MIIYRNFVPLYDLVIDSQTTITRRLMVENSLTLRVNTAAPLDLQIGDCAIVDGERYELQQMPDVTIASDGVYGYDAILYGNIHRLDNWLVEQSGNESFYYYGTAQDHLDFILATIGTKEAGWSVKTEGTLTKGTKNIDYASMSCLSALHKFTEAFSLEFDLTGKTIDVAQKIERPSDFDFAVGRGKGLYKISRGKASGQKITTRMFGLGGKHNTDDGLRLTFDEKFLERNVDLYGLREDKVTFDDIFPRRNGRVSSDATQLETGKVLWRVTDNTMDFDLNKQLVDGAKIVFNSGDCAGVEFEISSYDDANKTITFKEFTDESQTPPYTLPRAERYPRVGDEYVYIGITMPDSYVVAAKAELRAATLDEITRSASPQHPYTVEIDPRYIAQFDTAPKCGDLVRISHDKIGLDAVIRIIGITFPVGNMSSMQITINDKILISGASSLMRTVRREIAAVDGAGRFHPMMGSSTTPLVASNIRVIKDIDAKNFTTPEFAPLMVGGYGAGMITDPDTGKTHVWVDTVHARDGFETVQMKYRQLLVSGEELMVSSGGKVEQVMAAGLALLVTAGEPHRAITTQDGQFIVLKSPNKNSVIFSIKGEQGVDLCPFAVGDILKYSYRTDESLKVGFVIVTVVAGDFVFEGRMVEGSPELLPQMTLAQFGSVSDVDRQGFVVISARDRGVGVYDKVDSTVMGSRNLMGWFGRLEGIVDKVLGKLTGYGIYTQNFFGYGELVLKSTGEKVSSMFKVTADSITSLVTKTDATDELLSSTITQTASAIQSKVSSGSIISTINQTAEAVKIKAEKIELEGLVKANDLFVDGLIRADKIDTNTLVARNIDTRTDGAGMGVVMNNHFDAICIYDIIDRLCIKLSNAVPRGSTIIGEPVLELNGHSETKAELSIGYGLRFWDIVGDLQATFSRNRIVMPPHAHINMPGVLCAGRVNKFGSVETQWGCKECNCTRFNGQAGQYKIIHDIGHTDYYVNVTPVSNRSWTKVHGAIIDKQPPMNGEKGYFVVGMFDSGTGNSTTDYDFEFMICGQN